jgi:hypothetical protein
MAQMNANKLKHDSRIFVCIRGQNFLISGHQRQPTAKFFLLQALFLPRLFPSSAFHGIVVLAEAFAPMMKRFLNLNLHSQSTPEPRHDCYWATAALFQ